MKLSNKRIVGGVLGILFVTSVVQTGAILKIFNTLDGEGQSAQVTGSMTSVGTNQRIFGPQHNGQSFSFKGSTTASIKLCGGGGGGGGGHQVLYNYSGAGGGGGGMGNCYLIPKMKFRTSDVLTWSIGQGGAGGQGGIDFQSPGGPDQSPTAGQSGGQTRLYVNGSMVAQASGGNGGGSAYPFQNVMTVGGLGGSLTTPQALWHLGQNGLTPPYGNNGGTGGKGETNTTYGGGAGGVGGTAAPMDAFGHNGSIGNPTFGGGGGGGASTLYQMDTNYPPYYYVNKGGNGGGGGGGTITINY